MAPDITSVSAMPTPDIRVPPTFITDHAIFDIFPELSKPRCLSISTVASCSNSFERNNFGILGQDYIPPATFHADTCLLVEDVFQEEGLLAEDMSEYDKDSLTLLQDSSCASALLKEDHSSSLYEDLFHTEGTADDSREGVEADDLFDSEYVLPDNCQWWQQVGDLPGEFHVVDFVDHVKNATLYGDVDTCVSVTDDHVKQERALHEPVYCLDTWRTTVWGLDIIWEEDEEEIE